jgi:tetraacyldisaccharide 4'-kinase
MLTFLYYLITSFRNFAYDNKIFKIIKVDRPVISIGNITAGGTGKTPIVDLLIKHCLSKNKKCGIISRGYGGSYKGIVKVPQDADPSIYGDEPSMLAKKNPNCPIYLCKDKVKAAQELISKENVDVIIADDAFQHRRLFRDVDVVVIDALESIKNYRLLPWGRAREAISHLKRADFLILNKLNFINSDEKNKLLDFLSKNKMKSEFYINGNYKVSEYENFGGSPVLPSDNYLLVSGIGNPKSFEALLLQNKLNFKNHMVFADHHNYTLEDINNIVNKTKEIGVKNILTTEKDAIKLQLLTNKHSDLNWHITKLKVELLGAEKLNEKIDRLFI